MENQSVRDIPAAGGPGGAGRVPADLYVPPVLTPVQREVVTAPDRVLCVLAGAGAGKTRVLTLRVAHRVHDGSAAAEHVLVCTFSRKAASELRRRLWVLGVGEHVHAGTFHRTALRLLRQHRADRGAAPPVLLADRRPLLASLLEGVVGDATGAGRRAGDVNRLEAEIGWAKARLVTPEAYEDASRRARRRPAMDAARVAELYDTYERSRHRKGLLDLDDLLWDAADLLESDGRFASAVRWRYRHVFVDEMQDVNPAQFRVLRAIVGDDPDLFVVGDPLQSVYGWNGADPTLLDRLPLILPGTRVVRLDENHRSSPQVVAVAASVLGPAGTQEGPGGTGEQAGGGGTPTSSRPDGPLPCICEHVSDHDEAAWVARQVWLAHRPGRRWAQIAVLARTNAQLEPLAHALAAERVPVRMADGTWGPVGDLRPTGGDGREDDDLEGAGTDGDAVVLSTFHRAKGLQWPAVFVVGLSDGYVPISAARTPAAREEERRLLYVALTRAEDELTCTWAAHKGAGTQAPGAAPRRPSPWLEEMRKTRHQLEAEAAPSGPAGAAAHIAELRTRLEAGGPAR